MRKTLLLTVICLMIVSLNYAQTSTEKGGINLSAGTPEDQQKLASIKWDKIANDFGKVDQNKPVTAVFQFTNTSNVPLIIGNAKGSCGCTNVTYTKEPVLPGKKGQVTATYDAKSGGTFHKTVTVTANTPESTVLSFNGEVIPGTVAPGTPVAPSAPIMIDNK